MKKIFISVGIWLLPAFAFAQTQIICPSSGGLCNVLKTIQGLLNVVMPILVTIGVIMFIWGVIEYVIGKTEEAKKEGRDKMIYGIIGLFVIVSVWGLVSILQNTFGTSGQNIAPPLPIVGQ